jgi:4-hydroxy-4-methyl-2-oxoglutarate aldolase
MYRALGGPAEISRLLACFDTATLYEAAGRVGAMSPRIRPLQQGARVAGPAFTVNCPAGDNLMLIAAVSDASAGDIIVAQTHDPAHSVWGELLTIAASFRGIAGLVLDGSVRDIDTIGRLGFPVFACGSVLRASRKEMKGAVGVEISCGDISVQPGDYVVGDDSGVAVVAQGFVDDVITAAKARLDREQRIAAALYNGERLVDLLELKTPT